jgi:Uma2 family endonuclease
MKLWEEKYREPDVLYMRKERLGRCKGKFWEGADLVVEVLSESNREEDLETKRAEYARAEIPEYWIVDRTARTITILTLAQRDYVVHAAFKEGEQATSKILPGLAMDVTSALAAE